MPYASESLFGELAIVLAIAAGLGVVARVLRQPLIVALIALGIFAGPSGIDVVMADNEVWELLATMGISLLLFLVGLKLDVHVIRQVGPVALATGLGQVTFTAAVGYGLAIVLGLSPIEALYASVALTFSSTIIIVKLLTDKREIDSLHGHIAVGLLIVQDIVVILAMIGLTSFGAGAADQDPLREALFVLVKGAAMLGVIALLMRFALTPLFSLISRANELLVLAAIAWAVVVAFVSDQLGFSTEVGAFLAGVALASTPFREAIGARLVSIRDFMLVFFFLTLGAGLDLSLLGLQLGPAVVLSLFVLIGNPLIVMAIMRVMGYRKRTGFFVGLTVAQISEFSFVLVALGASIGHVGPDTVGLVTLVGLITIGASTYLIIYSHPIYQFLAPYLDLFESRNPSREQLHEARPGERFDVIVFGMDAFGSELADILTSRGKRVLGVDFDPERLRAGATDGLRVLYGDAEDPEFLASLPIHRAAWVLSTIPSSSVNKVLLQTLQTMGFRGKTAIYARDPSDVDGLAQSGLDLVFSPVTDVAQRASELMLQREGQN